MGSLGARQSSRDSISDMIRHITRGRACLWWEAPQNEETPGYARV